MAACCSAPGALEGALGEAAPAVLGALSDRESGGHAALWEMLLTFGRAFPGAWGAVDARKAVLPRLFAALRRAPAPALAALLRNVGQRLLHSVCNSVAAPHLVLPASSCGAARGGSPLGRARAPACWSTECAEVQGSSSSLGMLRLAQARVLRLRRGVAARAAAVRREHAARAAGPLAGHPVPGAARGAAGALRRTQRAQLGASPCARVL